MAAGAGLPVPFYETLVLVLLAVTATLAMRALGIILVAAMLVTPAATAYLFVKRLRHQIREAPAPPDAPRRRHRHERVGCWAIPVRSTGTSPRARQSSW
jgi:hypothetical protein